MSHDENEDTDIETPGFADERTPSILTESFLNDVDATNADAAAEWETQTQGEETKGETKEMEIPAPDAGPLDGCAAVATIGKMGRTNRRISPPRKKANSDTN